MYFIIDLILIPFSIFMLPSHPIYATLQTLFKTHHYNLFSFLSLFLSFEFSLLPVFVVSSWLRDYCCILGDLSGIP